MFYPWGILKQIPLIGNLVMPDPTLPTIALETSGVHHEASLLLDPNTKAVTGGTIVNFTDRSSVGFQMDSTGSAVGTITHRGNTHAFRATAEADGNFSGVFEDQRLGVAIAISGGVATLKRGQIPKTGIQVQGDHHTTKLQLDQRGRLSGTVESRLGDGSDFRIEIKDGKITGGSFIHQGNNHNTRVTFTGDRWSAEVGGRCGDDGRWAIAIDRGKAELTAKAQMELKF